MLDPVVNFKIKQKVKFIGACMTVGVDYLSDLAHWRLHYAMEVLSNFWAHISSSFSYNHTMMSFQIIRMILWVDGLV